MQREEDRIEKIQQFFQKQMGETKIIDYECSEANGEILLECLLQNKRKTTILLGKLYTVSFEEWKYIARWSSRINDERLRRLVNTEAV